MYMSLSQKQLECINYLLEGRSITDVAKLCMISRQTVYSWKDNKEFKAELDKRRQDMKNDVNRVITERASTYLEQLHVLATTAKSEKVRSQACQYLLDRCLGKATTKVEGVGKEDDDDNKKVVDIEAMLKNIS